MGPFRHKSVNDGLIVVLMPLSQFCNQSTACRRKDGRGAIGPDKYKTESVINFSISLCGYLIIVLVDSQGLFLNINMQKKSYNQKDGILD